MKSIQIPMPDVNRNIIKSMLRCLQCLYPIRHLLVIGAGDGSGQLVRELRKMNVDRATMVEADVVKFAQLQRLIGDKPNWLLRRRLIGPVSGPTTYHKTTVASENGLLHPGKLGGIWKRIHLREEIVQDAQTLSDLIGNEAVPPNWLVIDCMPSLEILKGAGSDLSGFDMILARTCTVPFMEEESLEDQKRSLDALGFRFTAFEPGRNPLLGRALFVRNHEKELLQCKDSIQRLEKELDHFQVFQEIVDRYAFGVSNTSDGTDASLAGGAVDPPLSKNPVNSVVDHLAKSAQSLRRRSHALRSGFSAESPVYGEMILLDAEIGVLQHELQLSLERGQLQMAQNEHHEFANMDDLNQKWKEKIKSRAVSQLGQELWVLDRCSYKRGGYFVEFGATNGVLLSNTWLLEKDFGWNGICAEPNPKFFEELKVNRLCTISSACIGPRTGEEVAFVFADVFGGMLADIDKDEHRSTREAYLHEGGVTNLVTISLNDFLIENQAPRRIDYLSIDTEGSEFSILENFPFKEWDIRHITVEHNQTPQRILIRELLSSHGYQCQEAKWDDWYYKD